MSISDKNSSMVWRFPYPEQRNSKVVFECSCGEEMELVDIKREKNYKKDNNYDIYIQSLIDTTAIQITCGSCDRSIKIKHRGYTPEEESEEREIKIDNLLKLN